MKKALLKCVLFASVCATFGFAAGCATDQPVESDTAQQSQGLTSDGADDFIGGGGGSSCPAKDGCYWVCRLQHPCATNPSQCGPLGSCLTACDIEFPTCS